MRIVLSERLGISPRDLRVDRTDAGKPVVAEGVHFNVTHSGGLILMAMSDTRPVGVDVERKRDVERVSALMDRWLTEDERAECLQLAAVGATPSDAFLRVWSLKEARLKALGVGIAGASSARLESVHAQSLDELLDSLPSSHDEQGYVGALAFA